MKIALDIGGVISKYPDQFKLLINQLQGCQGIEIHIISDMHPIESIASMLELNDFNFRPDRIHSADYNSFGEECKAILCEQLGIDILIDDFIGYVATANAPMIRLLVMPDASRPYYHDTWKTDGKEADFGRRRNPSGLKRPISYPVVEDMNRTSASCITNIIAIAFGMLVICLISFFAWISATHVFQ